MLTYVSSVKLTALLSFETGVQGSLEKNMPGTYQLECSHHTVSPTLGTSTKRVGPLDKIGNSVIQDPLLQIYHCIYANSKILTTLDAHVFSTIQGSDLSSF